VFSLNIWSVFVPKVESVEHNRLKQHLKGKKHLEQNESTNLLSYKCNVTNLEQVNHIKLKIFSS
jgi:hypothetical protein